jgi:thiol-disulfide isomerase/thioredoxin
MQFRKLFIFSLLVLTSALNACTTTKSNESMLDNPTKVMLEIPTEVMLEKPTEVMLGKSDENAMMDVPAWYSVELTNVNSGENFTINDFKGKVVLVETMAQWCSNCKKQQLEVKSLHEELSMNKDLITIALDIDPNENGEDLKNYAASNGFDWIYAVSPAGVSRELGNLYGDQFLNPPSTPILVIDREGVAHPLPFGIKSADDLYEALKPYLDASM